MSSADPATVPTAVASSIVAGSPGGFPSTAAEVEQARREQDSDGTDVYEQITVRRADGAVATVYLIHATTGPYGDPSSPATVGPGDQQDQSVVVALRIAAVSGTWRFAPTDFVFRTRNGATVQEGANGAGRYARDEVPPLTSTTVGAGRAVEGSLTFRIAAPGGLLQYEPGGHVVASWRVADKT